MLYYFFAALGVQAGMLASLGLPYAFIKLTERHLPVGLQLLGAMFIAGDVVIPIQRQGDELVREYRRLQGDALFKRRD